MKLLTKSLIAVGTIGATVASAGLGIYFYSKNAENPKNATFHSDEIMSNEMKEINSSLSKMVSARAIKISIVVPNGAGTRFLDNVDYSDVNNPKVGSKKLTDYVEEYRKANKGLSPYINVHFGSLLFQNQDLLSITADDFVKYSVWFVNNVSWGAEIHSLDSFTIVNGEHLDSTGNVVLGGHASSQKESENIKFYVGSFFSPAKFNKGKDKMLYGFGAKSKTLKEIKSILKSTVNPFNKQSSISKVQKLTPYSISPVLDETGNVSKNAKGEELFEMNMSYSKELVSGIHKKYSYHLTKKTGPHFVEKNGEYTVENGEYETIDDNEDISRAEIYSLNKNFKGFGLHWLQYVGTHEYGHHQTLNDIANLSGKSSIVSSWKSSSNLGITSKFSLDALNMYLRARAPELEAIQVGPMDKEKVNGNFIAFKVGGVRETNKEIFGTDTRDLYVYIPKKSRSFQTLKELTDRYQKYNSKNITSSKSYLGVILNSLDNNSGTIIPTFSSFAKALNSKGTFSNVDKKFVDDLKIVLKNDKHITAEQKKDIEPLITTLNALGTTVTKGWNSSVDQNASENFRINWGILDDSKLPFPSTPREDIPAMYQAIFDSSHKSTKKVMNLKQQQVSLTDYYKDAITKYVNSAGTQQIKDAFSNGIQEKDGGSQSPSGWKSVLNLKGQEYTVTAGLYSDFMNLHAFYGLQHSSDGAFAKLINMGVDGYNKGIITGYDKNNKIVKYESSNGEIIGESNDMNAADKEKYLNKVDHFKYEIGKDSKFAVSYSSATGLPVSEVSNKLLKNTLKNKTVKSLKEILDLFDITDPKLDSQDEAIIKDSVASKLIDINVMNSNKFSDQDKNDLLFELFSINPYYKSVDVSTKQKFEDQRGYFKTLDQLATTVIGYQTGIYDSLFTKYKESYYDASLKYFKEYDNRTNADGKKRDPKNTYNINVDKYKTSTGFMLMSGRTIFMGIGSIPIPEHLVIMSALVVPSSAKPAYTGKKYITDNGKNLQGQYVFSLPEMLTRDFAQISYLMDAKQALSSGMSNAMNERNTGLEFFYSGMNTSKFLDYWKYVGHNKNTYKDSHGKDVKTLKCTLWEFYTSHIVKKANLEDKKIFEKHFSTFNKKSVIPYIASQIKAYDKLQIIGKNVKIYSGFLTDYQQRKGIGWQMYKEDGVQEKYEGYGKNIMTDLQGVQAKGRADAMWYYLLKSKGIGNRSLSGIWRDKKRDSIYMWGYLQKDDAKNAKYLAFENAQGEIKYAKVHINQDNLHYYTKQNDASSKKTLRDEGYTGWTIDWQLTGSYKNAKFNIGSYKMYFVDGNHKKVKTKTTMIGNQKMVTENGKQGSTASTLVKQIKGDFVFVVKRQFQ